jgi:hypothetical protein
MGTMIRGAIWLFGISIGLILLAVYALLLGSTVAQIGRLVVACLQ